MKEDTRTKHGRFAKLLAEAIRRKTFVGVTFTRVRDGQPRVMHCKPISLTAKNTVFVSDLQELRAARKKKLADSEAFRSFRPDSVLSLRACGEVWESAA